jgi:hypothetical protein
MAVPQARLVGIDLIAAQSDRLAHPQTATVEHERQQTIADAMPTAFTVVTSALSRRARGLLALSGIFEQGNFQV